MYSGTIVGTNEGKKKQTFSVTLGYIVTYVNKYTPAFMDDVYKKIKILRNNTNVLFNVNDSYR